MEVILTHTLTCVKAGKALNERKAEIRVQFKSHVASMVPVCECIHMPHIPFALTFEARKESRSF